MKIVKAIALMALITAIPVSTSWAVSVISDPVHDATANCGFQLDSGTRINYPIAMSGTNKICKLDISSISVGSHTVNATAVPTPGTPYNESLPSATLTFTRPGPAVAPIGLTLSTNTTGEPIVQSNTIAANSTICSWRLNSAVLPDVAPVGGRCSIDLAPLTSGTHVLSVAQARIDSIWGRLESPTSANFTYVVPTTLNAPSGLKLAP